MLERFYKALIYTFTLVSLDIAIAKFWSMSSTKIAIRLYYGNKSTWEKIYMIYDQKIDYVTKDLILNIGYSLLDEPTVIIDVTPEECLLNKCTPDFMIAKDPSFIHDNAITYPIGRFSSNTLSYVGLLDNIFSSSESIVPIPIWKEDIFFANIKNSKNKSFVDLLIKSISLDISLRDIALVESRIAEMEKRSRARLKNVNKMRDKAIKYRQIVTGSSNKTA